MGHMYGMQRANGDWFAMGKSGSLHMPVYRSLGAAVCGHWRNSGMMLFRPKVLDEQALRELAVVDEAGVVGFWLVENPLGDPSRGDPLDHAQLALLVRDPVEQQTEPHTDTDSEISGLSNLPRSDNIVTEIWEDEGGG